MPEHGNTHAPTPRGVARACACVGDGQANELMHTTDEIVRTVDALRFAPFKAKALREIMENVQHQVDLLSRDALTNLDQWVAKLNERIEGILDGRLRAAARAWTTAFAANLTGGRTAASVGSGLGDSSDVAAGTGDDTPLANQSFDASTGANVGLPYASPAVPSGRTLTDGPVSPCLPLALCVLAGGPWHAPRDRRPCRCRSCLCLCTKSASATRCSHSLRLWRKRVRRGSAICLIGLVRRARQKACAQANPAPTSRAQG